MGKGAIPLRNETVDPKIPRSMQIICIIYILRIVLAICNAPLRGDDVALAI